ncbi:MULTISPECIES: cell wall hydrolase [Bacillus]|uniref:cell wall hydrolase n=1 Tax=Bacillus TaxID=1386 RepID=UPI0022437D23|nr:MULTISPECIES: cell wall hydrolase [Bacillus]MDN5387244.1 cell wall hydrolase [Bacillus sp. LB7]MEC1021911.1 cell wall hydrolase [Bacillus paralicheniformis]MEC1025268.1 cell wall hydrolase [Bacillus paralicheniformis]MEC1036025.1 cell wall hydrolase [Bacillus paralicheniformis]MEC1052741.1 cell wall hydrolase [Bacillus paralicheniformis]
MKSKFAALAAFLICMLPAARIEHAQAVMLFSKKDKQEMERLMESLKQEENPAFSQLTDEKSFVEAAHLPAEEEEEKEETTDLTQKEKDLLSRLVHAEAKGESFEGKVAVANVVLNRVEDGRFPDSVKSVIYQRNAFEPVLNGSIEKKADRESVEAVEEAVDQNKKETDALFFYNPDIASDDWIKTRKVVKRIGNHVFAI